MVEPCACRARAARRFALGVATPSNRTDHRELLRGVDRIRAVRLAAAKSAQAELFCQPLGKRVADPRTLREFDHSVTHREARGLQFAA